MDDQPTITLYVRLLRFFRRFFLWIILAVVFILLAISFELGRASVYSAHPEFSGQEQASKILANVGKLIQLPANETPSMAAINDAVNAKKGQPFLINAENGDVLIIYAKAAEALLYRPSTDKLIAVGPVDNSAASAQAGQNIAPLPVATSTENATNTKQKK
ncbi:MAG: hypothetical protein ACYCZZ_03150 [Minisyncoccota bacterium]